MFNKSQLSIFSLLMIVLISMSSAAGAATIIKIQDENEVTTMLTNGKRVRINMSADKYIIVDFSSQKIKIVNPLKKQVMIFDSQLRHGKFSGTSANSALVRLTLNDKGQRMRVAGYMATKYEYSANGKRCGDMYASKEVLQVKGISELISAMQAMIEQQRAVMGGFAAMMDDCMLADMQLTDKVQDVGLPMMRQENGRVTTQVKSIEVDVVIPSNTFVVPPAYKQISLEEQIQQAYEGMSQTMQGLSTQNPAPNTIRDAAAKDAKKQKNIIHR